MTTQVNANVSQTSLALAKQLFPDEGLTQQFAAQAIEVLSQAMIIDQIGATRENIGAIVQTFAKGAAFNDFDIFQQDVLFHFTYERTVAEALPGVIQNPNAVDEINAVTSGIDGGFTFTLRESGGIVDDTPPVVSGQLIDPLTGERLAEGVLDGGELFRISRVGREDTYIQMFRIPGTNNFAYYQYSNLQQVQRTFGDNLPSVFVMSESEFLGREGSDLFFAGEAGEIIGLGGNFQQLFTSASASALRAAGVNDPALLGKLLADPEVAGIIAINSIAANPVTGAELQAQLRQTNVWRNEIYPGIDFFYSRGDDNPEQAWVNYQRNVTDGLRNLGFAPDADGSYRTKVGEMLSAGIDDGEFNQFLPTAITIQQNPGLKAQMDQWAIRELNRDLNWDEFVDVLRGTSDPELQRVVESATLAYAAERAGVTADVADIRRLAAETDLTPQQALDAFSETERRLLAIGTQDLAVRGISRGDILDFAAGIKPRSGKTAAEVAQITTQLAVERGLSDNPQARFFTNFTDRGSPQRAGLQSLNPLGG